MEGRGAVSKAAVVAVVAVMVMAGSGEAGHNYVRRSNTDLKALREKHLAVINADDGPCVHYAPGAGDPPLPVVPRSFMTQLEILIHKGNLETVFHGVEMYESVTRRGVNDYDLSSGVISGKPELLRAEMHYSQVLDEALFLTTKNPCIITGEQDCDAIRKCVAGNITDLSAEIQNFFGDVDTNNGEEFIGAMGLMQFGPMFNYSYVMDSDCRGAVCNVFQACKPVGGNDTVLYTYYWTDNDWDVENNDNSTPIAVQIVDSRKDGVTMEIDFYNFKREWMPATDELEVPVDVYCEGKETFFDQPSPVDFCSYKSELVEGIDLDVDNDKGDTDHLHIRMMFPQKEWYDYTRKVSKTEFVPYFLSGGGRRFENLTQEVLEFTQGLSYIVHPRLSNCEIKHIEPNMTFGQAVVEDGTVHMRNPWDWESLSDTMQYNGQHWVRGMSADVWVGITPTEILGLKSNKTVVWYFASPFTNDMISTRGKSGAREFKLPNLDKVPIQYETYDTYLQELPRLIYNIYDYEASIPMTHQHDVSLCYPPDKMRNFRFDLEVHALEYSLFLQENLLYAVQGALHETGNVSPVRINRLECMQTKTAVQIMFTILEKPSSVADVTGDEKENTMDVAVESIRDAINSNSLTIAVMYGNKPNQSNLLYNTTALPNTMTEITRGEDTPVGTKVWTGYNAGDMAGLGVGMIIVGILMGFGGMYLYGKRG